MEKVIEHIMRNYGFGMSVKEAVNIVYRDLRANGYEVCIVNDRYIEVEDQSFQLLKTRSKGHWTARQF